MQNFAEEQTKTRCTYRGKFVGGRREVLITPPPGWVWCKSAGTARFIQIPGTSNKNHQCCRQENASPDKMISLISIDSLMAISL